MKTRYTLSILAIGLLSSCQNKTYPLLPRQAVEKEIPVAAKASDGPAAEAEISTAKQTAKVPASETAQPMSKDPEPNPAGGTKAIMGETDKDEPTQLLIEENPEKDPTDSSDSKAEMPSDAGKSAKPEATEPQASTTKTPDLTLLPSDFPLPSPQLLPVTKKIYAQLKEDLPDSAEGMKAYKEVVPEINDTTFEMIPLPGGTVTIGSPDSEANRNDDEKILKDIKIEPFWIASTETTWGLYKIFMQTEYARNKDGSINYDGNDKSSENPDLTKEKLTDVVTQPTPPYMGMHFNMGEGGYSDKYPAISMTQHAASKFCEWLTAYTGHYYRLPTEAEWEYACRAGTTTAYSFGDDPAQLGDYAWTEENSEFEYHPVATKKPNPWGLYDMHGNAAEWCLDFYLADRAGEKDGQLNPLPLSAQRYPRVTKGGHWDTVGTSARSAARIPSNKAWKNTDPQIPKSIWYHTDAPFIGFRVVRPLAKPSIEEMHLLWNLGPGEVE